MLGTIFIWMGFTAALVAAFSYYRLVTNKVSDPTLARRSFWVVVLSVVGASVLLMFYILNHQFEYSYVWGYSSKDLPLHLLVTTFWAGQEGSFLFWTLCAVLIGIALQKFTRRNKIECEVMSVYMLTVAVLLLLMIAKSPFQYMWEAYPDQLTPGNVPNDGRGLNPLLQNVWMIAHPPVMFVGFAALAVPFALAMAALWRKRYGEWVTAALPWVGFGALSLGLGLILGGYWAYGVLGWGGWWGWDPVENSSLIPWMTTVILLHTLLVQKKTGKLARTNFVLAIVSFLLVVYSTFLTRSGILGESSVHSFVNPGNLVYSLLIGWIALMSSIGFVMLSRRWKELKRLAIPVGSWSRESLLALGAVAMALSAFVIFLGTSWPIVSNATVEPSFYDKTNLPIAIALSLLLGFSLFTRWSVEDRSELAQRSVFPLVLSLIAAVILYLVDVRDWHMLVFAFSSFFILVITTRLLVMMGKEDPRLVGGPLAHFGLAILFLGIIGSGRYGEKVSTALPINQPTSVLGYEVTYKGAYQKEDGKSAFMIEVQKGGSRFRLEPVMYMSTYTNSVMRNPDYASSWTRDFYIEPVSLERGAEHHHSHNTFELKKGEPQTIGDYRVTFEKFDMGGHGMQGMMSGGGFSIGAVLTVEKGKKKEQVVPFTLYSEHQEPKPKEAKTKDGLLGFQMVAMQVGSDGSPSRIRLLISGLPDAHEAQEEGVETLVIEASVKPFINFVWLGAGFVLVGFALSMARRTKDVRVTGKSRGSFQHLRRAQTAENEHIKEQTQTLVEP